MNEKQVIERLKGMADREFLPGMSQYGIDTSHAWGVKIPQLRALAKEVGRDHALAQNLWAAGYRETRILAGMIEDASEVGDVQMELWVKDFRDWEVCDQTIMNLFEDIPCAYHKARQWSARPEEFVKRAGYVMMARLAVSDKEAPDTAFDAFLPLIIRGAGDNRNFVRKAVNWALRQIGKRNRALNSKAVALALEIAAINSPSARWIAADALRELRSKKF